MSGLTTAAVNRVIDATNATATLTVATAPIKVRLTTTAPTAAAAGTEVTGGSYVSQTYTAAAASAATASNNSILTYSSMPATTVVGVDMFDSTGTPFRWWWGPLTANKTTNAGDTLSFAIGAIVQTITS